MDSTLPFTHAGNLSASENIVTALANASDGTKMLMATWPS